jgi:hypothetical protein
MVTVRSGKADLFQVARTDFVAREMVELAVRVEEDKRRAPRDIKVDGDYFCSQTNGGIEEFCANTRHQFLGLCLCF